jgi:hypothetical protein
VSKLEYISACLEASEIIRTDLEGEVDLRQRKKSTRQLARLSTIQVQIRFVKAVWTEPRK